MKPFLLLALGLSLVAVGPLRADSGATAPITIMRLTNGERFGLIGGQAGHPAPTLFVLASGLEGMQREPGFSEVGRLLLPHGFVSVIIDPPAHGADVRPGEPKELNAWRTRIEKGEDVIGGAGAYFDSDAGGIAHDG